MIRVRFSIEVDVDSICDFEDEAGNTIPWEPAPSQMIEVHDFAKRVVSETLTYAREGGELRDEEMDLCITKIAIVTEAVQDVEAT